MHDHVAIRVTNLSKCYHIYDRPRDRLLQTLWRGHKRYFREFWAVKDVSIEIKKGETVGIIGRNGSGKSTLLQIICGILAPTSGSVQTSGRIAALLELGAGFNPEFTGRENVYMNAAVLGLSSEAIDERFDNIASFADIGEFLEQPVKTYSSGMYVRLAFSVAVAIDPDILVVDEALSVGDLAFQNKCMARIRKLSERGVTVLFVTHDLSTSQVICSRAVWLHEGRVARVGDPVQVCREYYVASLGNAAPAPPPEAVIPQQQTGLAQFVKAEVVDSALHGQTCLFVGERLVIRFALAAAATLESTVFALSIYRSDGDWLIGQSSREARVIWPPSRAGELVEGEIVLDSLSLAPGDYRIALAAYSQDLAICYALTGLLPGFRVQADFPTWGKVIHPIVWRRLSTDA